MATTQPLSSYSMNPHPPGQGERGREEGRSEREGRREGGKDRGE